MAAAGPKLMFILVEPNRADAASAAVLRAGAQGATLYRARNFTAGGMVDKNAAGLAVVPEREAILTVVGPDLVDPIAEGVRDTATEDGDPGFMLVMPVAHVVGLLDYAAGEEDGDSDSES